MREVGYEVIHYGVEGADSGANQQIDVIGLDEWNSIRNRLLREVHPDKDVNDSSRFIGDLANIGNDLYREFNTRLRYLLHKNTAPGDIVCLPFGQAHKEALVNLPNVYRVETGIGYPGSYENFRVFESYAWYHTVAGEQGVSGNDYWWVIPNYFITEDWDFQPQPLNYVAYFGRLGDIKGVHIVQELARHRPDLPFIICGQGDPTPYLTEPNIIYHPPIHGRERSSFLGNAMAVLMPTRYIEPFGGVAVEAQLCGTPVIGSTWGSFTETIIHGETGYRCHTLGDYLAALEAVGPQLTHKRGDIRARAIALYDYRNIAPQYDQVFTQISNLQQQGWYTIASDIGPIEKAIDYSKDTDPVVPWAKKHSAQWNNVMKAKPISVDSLSPLLMIEPLGLLETVFGDEVILTEIGGGAASVLPSVQGGQKQIIDIAYYGDDVDAQYTKMGIPYILHDYTTIKWDPKDTRIRIGIAINVLEWTKSPEKMFEALVVMEHEVYLAEMITPGTLNILTAAIKAHPEITILQERVTEIQTTSGPQLLYRAHFITGKEEI